MPRLPTVRGVPWLMVLQLAVAAREHWHRLAPRERARLGAIVKKSKGRPANLTAGERQELKRIVAKLEPLQLARRALPLGGRVPGLGGRRKS